VTAAILARFGPQPQAADPLEQLAGEIGRTLIAIELAEQHAARSRARLEQLLAEVRSHLQDA
jgi:hypothetical protein